MIIKHFSLSSVLNRKSDCRPPFRFVAATTLFAFTTALPIAAWAAGTARKQVHASAISRATELIQQEAKRRSWSDFQVKMNVFMPAEVSQYAVCSQPLQTNMSGGERIVLARIRYEVRCDDSPGWAVAVTVKPDIYLPVVTAKNSYKRGHVLSLSDVTLKKTNIASARDEYVTDPKQIAGLTVKRRLLESQPISRNQLDDPILVNRGQWVLMIAGQNGVEGRTRGEALKKGKYGDVIKVKNESSSRVVSAVVDGPGIVRMLHASVE